MKSELNKYNPDNFSQEIEDYKNIEKELKEQKKNNLLYKYEYHVYYMHDNQSYIFKVAALNEVDVRNKASETLHIYEDLLIYDIVKT